MQDLVEMVMEPEVPSSVVKKESLRPFKVLADSAAMLRGAGCFFSFASLFLFASVELNTISIDFSYSSVLMVTSD